jgi:serine protease
MMDAGGWTYMSSVVDAALSCYEQGAKVINVGFGGPVGEYLEDLVFLHLSVKGVVSVAPAGNSGTTEKQYPAYYGGVVSVAAVDSSKRVASFSQRVLLLDLCALGVKVRSTLPRSQGRYGYMSGTSMASAHVAGVAAILFSKNPSASAKQVKDSMTSTAQDLGTAGRDTSYGYGLVDAFEALSAL